MVVLQLCLFCLDFICVQAIFLFWSDFTARWKGDLILKSIKLFEGLTSKEKESICSLPECRTTHYYPGESIYSKDKFERAIGIVLKGDAVVYTSSGDVPFHHIGRNECFGIAMLFCKENIYVSKIVASGECTVLFIPEQVILESIRKNQRFMENYLCLVSERIRYLNTLVDIYSSPNITARLAKYLLTHEKDLKLPVSSSLTELSNILSIGRASLYRSLEELGSAGAIEKTGKRIVVSDTDVLSKYANER